MDYEQLELVDLGENTVLKITDLLPQPFEWREIPAGPFLMGSDRSKDQLAYNNEPDLHELTLPAFYMAKYPVTYAQYKVFVGADGYTNRNYWTNAGWEWKADISHPEIFWDDFDWHDDHPMVGVTWYEAYAFTRWLSEQVGYDVRLPTEAEWEKSARGTDGRIYPYGNQFDPAKSNVHATGISKASPVAQFPDGASPYGVMDMSGNVLEWCLSNWSNLYSHLIAENVDVENDGRRVLRGGAWFSNDRGARSAFRGTINPVSWFVYLGFRLVYSE